MLRYTTLHYATLHYTNLAQPSLLKVVFATFKGGLPPLYWCKSCTYLLRLCLGAHGECVNLCTATWAPDE